MSYISLGPVVNNQGREYDSLCVLEVEAEVARVVPAGADLDDAEGRSFPVGAQFVHESQINRTRQLGTKPFRACSSAPRRVRNPVYRTASAGMVASRNRPGVMVPSVCGEDGFHVWVQLRGQPVDKHAEGRLIRLGMSVELVRRLEEIVDLEHWHADDRRPAARKDGVLKLGIDVCTFTRGADGRPGF